MSLASRLLRPTFSNSRSASSALVNVMLPVSLVMRSLCVEPAARRTTLRSRRDRRSDFRVRQSLSSILNKTLNARLFLPCSQGPLPRYTSNSRTVAEQMARRSLPQRLPARRCTSTLSSNCDRHIAANRRELRNTRWTRAPRLRPPRRSRARRATGAAGQIVLPLPPRMQLADPADAAGRRARCAPIARGAAPDGAAASKRSSPRREAAPRRPPSRRRNRRARRADAPLFGHAVAERGRAEHAPAARTQLPSRVENSGRSRTRARGCCLCREVEREHVDEPGHEARAHHAQLAGDRIAQRDRIVRCRQKSASQRAVDEAEVDRLRW